jgi:hypothetical protein
MQELTNNILCKGACETKKSYNEFGNFLMLKE